MVVLATGEFWTGPSTPFVAQAPALATVNARIRANLLDFMFMVIPLTLWMAGFAGLDVVVPLLVVFLGPGFIDIAGLHRVEGAVGADGAHVDVAEGEQQHDDGRYRMDDVDEVLTRLTETLRLREAQLAALAPQGVESGEPAASVQPVRESASTTSLAGE